MCLPTHWELSPTQLQHAKPPFNERRPSQPSFLSNLAVLSFKS